MLRMLKKMDGVILFVLLLLMVMSVFTVYSAIQSDPKLNNHHIKTLQFYGIGFVAVIGIALVNYKLYINMRFIFTEWGSFC